MTNQNDNDYHSNYHLLSMYTDLGTLSLSSHLSLIAGVSVIVTCERML